MLSDLREKIQGLSDDELFSVLDCVSEEVKRRNNIMGPSIPDIRAQSPEENVKMVIEALAALGVNVQKPEPPRPAPAPEAPAEPTT